MKFTRPKRESFHACPLADTHRELVRIVVKRILGPEPLGSKSDSTDELGPARIVGSKTRIAVANPKF
ncbi:MAG: hypothetical protein ACKN9S_16840 [Pirellula sp.]